MPFISWFRELSTHRQIGGFSLGPIPVGEITKFGERRGLNSVSVRLLEIVIQVMDADYVEWSAEEAKKNAPEPPPPGSRWSK